MTGFNSTRFIDDNSHFVVENYNPPTLGYDVAQEKVHSVTRNDLYEDILKYVAENYDPHFITLNIPANNIIGPTIEWIDKRTLQLNPGDVDSAVDYKVILTSDPTVFEKIDNTGDNYNQKTYNEYVYPQAVYAEMLKEHSIIEFFSKEDSDIPDGDRVSTIYLKNQIHNLTDYSEISTLTDSLYILDRVNSVQNDIDDAKDLIVSIYNSRRFGDYVIVKAAVADYATTNPTAGECVIEDDKEDNDIVKIKFSAYAFPETYLTNTNPPNYTDANVYNNYLANDFDSSVLRIQDYDTNEERSYALDKGATNADPAIFRFNEGAADEYYELQVQIKNNNDLSTNLINLNEDIIKVLMYRDTVGVDLLGNYVKILGDTMTGSLVMDNASILMEDGDITFTRTGTEDELSDIDNRFSTLKSIAPIRTDTGATDTEDRYGIKVDIDSGNSYKNNFTVSNRNGDIVKITGGVGAQIEFPTSGFTPNYANTGLTSGVAIRHIPTPSFENSPGDIAVNKQYVDQQDKLILDQITTGGCITINGGRLCGGEQMPRFYDVPNWSYKQKNSAGVVHGKSKALWWEHAKRWIYTTTDKLGAYNGLQIYISKTNRLDGTWELFHEARTNNSNSRIYLSFRGVGNKYLYYVQVFGYSSTNGNSFQGQGYRIDVDKKVDLLFSKSSLAGFDVRSTQIDADGNLGLGTQETKYYSTGYVHTQHLFFFRDSDAYQTYINVDYIVSGTQSAFFTNVLIPKAFMRGFYVSLSKQSGYNWHTTDTTNVLYFDPSGNFSRSDVMSRLAPGRTNFSYSTSTGDYMGSYVLDLNIGDGTGATPYTYITYNKELENFYCVQQYSDSNTYTLDGSMGFKVFRSKKYKYEDINWRTLDWKNLFTFANGAEEVLDSPNSYARSLDYIAGELFTNTYSGIMVFNGMTPGEPIIRHPYGKVWGSIDQGETWQFRETELRNDDGTLIPNTRAYISQYHPNQNTAPLPDGGDYINLNFTRYADTNEEFYNDEGGITDQLGHDDELTVGYQRYDLPFNVYTGNQALYWNGEQINLPPEEIDIPPTQITYAGTEGLTALTTTAIKTTTESNVTDGKVYTLRFNGDDVGNPVLTTSSYHGLFLTPEWIKAVTKNIPSDATGLELYDMSGEWKNQSSNSYHQNVSKANVAPATFNGITGVAVKWDYNNSVNSSYTSWRVNIPVTLRYVTTFGEGGLPILPLN